MRRWIIVFLSLILGTVFVTAQGINAHVIEMSGVLNLRSAPSRNAPIVAELAGDTPLIVLTRTTTSSWYEVQTEAGQNGWVSARYVDLIGIPLVSIPVNENPPTVSAAPASNSDTSTNTSTTTAATGSGTGRVNTYLLNVRAGAGTSNGVVGQLTGDTQVNLIGRNTSGSWLNVQTDNGLAGWVSARYISPFVAIDSLPVVEGGVVSAVAPTTAAATDSDTASADFVSSAPTGAAPYFVLGAESFNIYARGVGLGNNRTSFSKVGDSITVAPEMFTPIGQGAAQLGSYGHLRSTIAFFGGSFTRISQAAGFGWTTETVLNPNYANPAVCLVNESPLACEYRTHNPSVALIMFGTNDVSIVPVDRFVYNMRIIIEYSIGEGVIPVLSTIPYRGGYEGTIDFYNQWIVQLASEYGISLWDYAGVMRTLPDGGLSPDGVHPSAPPRGADDSANFTGGFLQYGYVQRNLTALQALEVVRTQVLN